MKFCSVTKDAVVEMLRLLKKTFHYLSPDMAPIEHALDELQRRIDRGPPLHTVADLRRALVREWNQIPQAFFRNLVESMRHRCLACIASNGGHTHY